jgi:hypothetical protein
VVPEVLVEPSLDIEGGRLDVIEFGDGEIKHSATVYVPLRALLSADLVYHDAHLYLQERHLQSWLARLDELEEFAKPRVSRHLVASFAESWVGRHSEKPSWGKHD